MESSLQHITLKNHCLSSGEILDINLSCQIFGQDIHSAPVILVNHALTGNSQITGENGWWQDIVGPDKIIDTNRFAVICFNIPGNGFDGFSLKENAHLIAGDVAEIFLQGLQYLKVTKLHTLIGGSIGGAIGWEMLALQPDLAENFVPVACDYRTSDWLYSQCLVQKFLLNSPREPIQKARLHAMLCYRTPVSVNERFQSEIDEKKGIRKSEDWLNFHGRMLSKRFTLQAYNVVNDLLMSIKTDVIKMRKIKSKILLIAVDSDLFFPAFEIKKCYEDLKFNQLKISYEEINSIHGHDAFLMEYDQLAKLLKPVFNEK